MTDKDLEYSDAAVFVGSGSFVRDLKKIVSTIAGNNASVLIAGEQGTGKLSFAKAVHNQGNVNKDAYFLEINCKVYTPDEVKKYFDLIKQFSASDSSKKTIYISNIDNLNSELQIELCSLIKILRNNRVNIRFIVSTEVNLEQMIDEGLFSKDLYFLISTIPVNMIPLRQREEDIIPLAVYYFNLFKIKTGRSVEGFSDSCKEDMKKAFWYGNLPELKNAVERGFIKGDSPFINSSDMAIGNSWEKENTAVEIFNSIFEQKDFKNEADQTLKTALNTFKKMYLTKLLEENGWNQTKTAKILGIQRTYVIRLMDELQIRK